LNTFDQLDVLLVEDSRSYAIAIKGFFEERGHRVTHAASGEEAIRLFQAQTPDMILMDVVMPGMDGIEATRQIRQLPADHWVPIIIMTSLGDDRNVIEGLEAGADEYIIKPIHFDVLDVRIKTMQRIANLQHDLRDVSQQLVQAEKMASIGQLAAGVAHEINTPIGFALSNIRALDTYVADLLAMLNSYAEAEGHVADETVVAQLKQRWTKLDIDFLKDDIPNLMRETKDGMLRIGRIVEDLKEFSRVNGTEHFQPADLNRGIESTLNMLRSELDRSADVEHVFGVLPDIECIPQQLNQVFMNVLVNAGQAMQGRRGVIRIETGSDGAVVWVTISDDGCGMTEAVRKKVFDPFFTTRDVGSGTGLGLSLAFGIVQRHHGSIEVKSELGEGSTFRITLPVRQPEGAT